jgi:hypothetical protein
VPDDHLTFVAERLAGFAIVGMTTSDMHCRAAWSQENQACSSKSASNVS